MQSEVQKKKHSLAGWVLLGAGLPALVMLVSYMVIGVWPFGDGTVLIIDSLHQYLPFYTDFHQKLTTHSSLFYSFSAGLGYNFWATYAYYLASPLNFLIALVPKAHVCDFMDYLILFKIALCGATMTWYLADRNRKAGLLAPAFGTMYALSFFMIGYYFNIMWLDSIDVLPLIMKGIERICGIGSDGIRSGRSDGRLYCAALCYGLWCNYYIGFMLCLFSVLYYLACTVIAGRVRPVLFLKRSARFLWTSLLAGGLGGLVLMPAYRALQVSESMQSNHFPKVIKFYADFVDLALSHFAGVRPINIANTQVGLNAYCGCAVLILVGLFLLDREISLRKRIAMGALAAFLLVSFSLNILNYIWHGLHQQNGLPNRFAFLYIALLLVMSFDAALDLKKLPIWRLVFSGCLPLVFILTVWVRGLGKDKEGAAYPTSVYQITLILVAAYFVLLVLARVRQAGRFLYTSAVSLLCISEAAVSAVWGVTCNDSVTRSIYLKDQKSFQTLVGAKHAPSWFRSEVDSQRMRDVTLFCGGQAIVMFNSTMQESVTNFCDRIGMESRTNKNGYNGVTKLMNDVLGVRYVLSSQGKGSSLYQFAKGESDGNLTLYENPDALSLGFVVKDSIRDWNIEAGTPIDVQNDFVVKATGLAPIYTLDRNLTMQSGKKNDIVIPEGKQVYVYLPSRVKELALNTPEYSKTYTTFTDHLYVIDGADGKREADLTATMDLGGSEEAIIYTCPDALEEEVVKTLGESQLKHVVAFGSQLTADLDAKQGGVLLLTLPYDRGWTAYVDGQKVRTEEIGSCLLGLEVAEGSHTLRMVYRPEGFQEGILISGLSLLLALISLILYGRRHKGEKMGYDAAIEDLCRDLTALCGEDAVQRRVKMSTCTTFRIGGEADLVVSPGSVDKTAEAVRLIRRRDLPFFVMGNGSNLLVSDRGVRGVILQIGKNLSRIETEGDRIYAQAGAMLSAVARAALDAGLTGMEPESGIPGTIGGGVFMNAGAYGGEMKDIVESVLALDKAGKTVRLTGEECGFGYRTSEIQKKGLIVLEVALKLTAGDRDAIRAKMADLKEKRVAKQPLDLPSAGSTFKRPEGHFAGALIDQAGMRGFRVGQAQVSEKHAGFVVNLGGATAEEVRTLIKTVQRAVWRKDRVRLEPEVRMLGFEDEGEDS